MKKKTVFFSLVIVFIIGCSVLIIKNSDRLIFSHKHHISAGVECLQCHIGIDEAQSTEEKHLPAMETCSQCHQEEVKEKCSICHTNPEKARKLTPSRSTVSFSHKSHKGRVKDGCITCHPAVEKGTSPKDRKLPEMKECVKCHRKDFDGVKCILCHPDLS